MIDKIPRTLFVYKHSGIDTAEIRGKQIATELGCDSISLPELTSSFAARYQVIVYVKRIPGTVTMKRIRSMGVKQVFDVLDNYWSWTSRRAAPYLDSFIGANLTQTVHLQLTYKTPAVEIPHHHCNFEDLRIPKRNGPPVIGFISTPDHWAANNRLAKKTGYKVISNVSRKGAGGFQKLIDNYMATDIGFTYRMDQDKLRFNCANKLTNYMSFGIPSVLTPESGYLEYGRHGETVMFAHKPEDFVQMIRWLGEDPALRSRMSDACYEAAKPFHIRRIADRYREFLRGL
ncbi:MAG: glycosyltransferase [Gemmatimonadaceae bacterium]